MKKVSIIIPCFNQGKYVQEAIESALKQTYKNIEIVCVNDGSNDETSEIVRSLADKYKNIIFFDLKENKGVINARNLAIDASTGDYILPLDADDIIEPTYIEKAVEILNNNSDVGIVYCKVRKFGTKNKIWKLPEFNLDNFLYENCIFNCALFRKEDFYKAGKYKENMINGCEDWDLWLSFVELELKPYKINEILFNYRQHKDSRTKITSGDVDWKINFFENHKDLYLKNEKFISNAFKNNLYLEARLKKYKKLYILFLTFFILQLFIMIFWSL